MKKFHLLLFCFFGLLSAFSQTRITLTFKGIDLTGTQLPLDSIFIANITEDCDTTLTNPYDSLLLTLLLPWPLGVDELGQHGEGSFILQQNFPNPFQGSTNVRIYRTYGGPLNLILFDKLGKNLAEFRDELDKGFYSFSVSSSERDILILAVFDKNNSRSIKIINTAPGMGNTTIQYNGQISTDEKNTLKVQDQSPAVFGFKPGDQFMITAYDSGCHNNTKFEKPVANGTYPFTMIPLDTPVAPTVITLPVSESTQTTAKSGGDVLSDGGSPVSDRGICWSKITNPTIADSLTTDGAGTGTFISNLTGLTPDSLYYVRAYAINDIGISYGNEVSFVAGQLVVLTAPVTNITQCTATCGGNITSDGGLTVTARGVCWGAKAAPTTTDRHTTDGTGSGAFTSSLTGLTHDSLYYVRAYAINNFDTVYGSEKSFTARPIGLAEVTTDTIFNITPSTATCGGNVISDGGSKVLFRGTCWSENQPVTISDQHTSDSSGMGPFESNLTGLVVNKLYYVRAYAINSSGTAYGATKTFTTSLTMATVTTTVVTSITQTTAISGGNVTFDGGDTVTQKGVCWSDTPTPTTGDSHTNEGTGTGEFTSNLNGLLANTDYYIRAYATNSVGTAYGNEESFKTLPNPSLAEVTTDSVTEIGTTTATSGGEVLSEGEVDVFMRGVCWNDTVSPSITDSHTIDGNGMGVFISNLTGLTPNTQYYVRAYAKNSVGTAYGNEVSFITDSVRYIGENFGGGIIFYLDATGQHGLIAATSDQGAGASWGCQGASTPETSANNGMGQINTTAIVTGCTESVTAARICDEYSTTVDDVTYDDWFLPSKDELYEMFIQKTAIGGFADDDYWSSTGNDANSAWRLSFIDGAKSAGDKSVKLHVRPVRVF